MVPGAIADALSISFRTVGTISNEYQGDLCADFFAELRVCFQQIEHSFSFHQTPNVKKVARRQRVAGAYLDSIAPRGVREH